MTVKSNTKISRIKVTKNYSEIYFKINNKQFSRKSKQKLFGRKFTTKEIKKN